VDKPILSETHGQCDGRPTVTFRASAGTHCAYPQRDGQAELREVGAGVPLPQFEIKMTCFGALWSMDFILNVPAREGS